MEQRELPFCPRFPNPLRKNHQVVVSQTRGEFSARAHRFLDAHHTIYFYTIDFREATERPRPDSKQVVGRGSLCLEIKPGHQINLESYFLQHDD